MYFYNWTDFFFYSDSENMLKSKICYNFHALNQTEILISSKKLFLPQRKRWLLLPATSTTQFAHFETEKAKRLGMSHS